MSDEKPKPYVFQEFPKMVYDHDNSAPSRINVREENGKKITEHVEPVIAFRIVNDEDELKAALKEGFSEEPAPQHPPVVAKEKAHKESKADKKHENKK